MVKTSINVDGVQVGVVENFTPRAKVISPIYVLGKQDLPISGNARMEVQLKNIDINPAFFVRLQMWDFRQRGGMGT